MGCAGTPSVFRNLFQLFGGTQCLPCPALSSRNYSFRRTGALLAILAILALAGTALGASAGHVPSTPRISRISPTTVSAGAKITISGRNFVPGSRRNVVIFRGEPGGGDDLRVRATRAP